MMHYKKPSVSDLLFLLAGLCMTASVLLVMEAVAWGPYLYCAGAAAYVAVRVKHLYRGSDFRLKRLNRIYYFSLLMVVATAWLMFTGNNSWLVLMLMVALLELYASFRSEYYHRRND